MAASDSEKRKYLPNTTLDWGDILKTHHNNHGGHNEKCASDSEFCSTEMATDIPEGMKPLCLWHRARMAYHVVIKCKCGPRDVCDGDGPARYLFRNYHNSWDMGVIEMGGTIYCCGSAQNGDSDIYKCGCMRVCAGCVDDHKKENLVPKSSAYSSDSSDDYYY